MDVRTRLDHGTLRLLGIIAGELRHPAKPPHVQSSHGRPGVKGAVKAGVKKIAEQVTDALDGDDSVGKSATKTAKQAAKSSAELKPKKDMTFGKFRDFQNAMEAREIKLDGDKLYPPGEQLPPDAYKSRTIQAQYLAPAIADRWQVDRADLEELVAENTKVPKSTLKGVPTEQLKRDFVEHSLIRHGGGGGSTTVAQAAAVADKLGLPYEPSLADRPALAYIKERPALDRALSSLGIAQYENTQAWLKDHGITEVTLARGMTSSDGDRAGLPYTSWAAEYGGVLGTEMGFGANMDFNDPEVQQKIYDAERPVRVATIPAELILSTGLTGFGTLNESEAVVLPLPKAPDAGTDPLTAKYKSERPSDDPLPFDDSDDELDDLDEASRTRRDHDTLRLLGIIGETRHLPGKHLQQSHGGDGGDFTNALDGLDDLNLEGRIDLDPGETFVGSQYLGSSDQDGMSAVLAVVDTPRGREFRIAVKPHQSSGEWTGMDEDTADLPEPAFREFARNVSEGAQVADRKAKEADQAWKTGPPTDPELLGTRPVWEDAAGMQGSGLLAEIWLTDDQPTSWTLQVTVNDEFSLQMDAQEAADFANEMKVLHAD